MKKRKTPVPSPAPLPAPSPASSPAASEPMILPPAGSALKERFIQALSRALTLHRNERLGEALEAYDEVVAIDPANPDGWANRGALLRRMGKREEAMACYWRALDLTADKGALWGNIANCLMDMNRREEAYAAVQNGLKAKPDSAELWRLLATQLLHKQFTIAGEAALRRAVALAPTDAATLIRLGSLLNQSGELDQSLEMLARAQELEPLNPDAIAGRGQTLISMGRLDEAEPFLRKAMEINIEHLDARLGLARKLLLEGALEPGWIEYEWRRRKPDSKMPKLPGREWNGEPLQGKTLLIHGEQGFGDLLQFARYIPILARQGARILLAVPPVLSSLFATVEGVAQMVANVKSAEQYDFHVAMLSIPRFVGISMKNIPAQIPYFKVAQGGPRLPAPVGTKLKLGIVWAGSPKHTNDRNRSVTLTTMLPLTGIAGVCVYSLQTGPHAGDILKEAHPALVRDISSYMREFSDTANIVSQLDLVICVDTSVAHLCGALGKPVWVLTPFAPDWRWLLHREDTPWYPTMRLLRQTSPQGWDDLIARCVEDLHKIVANRPDPAMIGETLVHSAFPAPDGSPRFKLPVPRFYLNDAGIRVLVNNERWGLGYEFATRSFIDAHLQPGDLFLDIGAHWGIMSLQAVSRWPGQIQALACEPAPRNLTQLQRWVEFNGLQERIEIIPAAIADEAGTGELRPESTMGHSLIKQDGGGIPVTTIDRLLAERPHLGGKRVVIKIDVEGAEPLVIAGMKALLESGRVAAVIWERGYDYDNEGGAERLDALRGRFAELGFTAWRFASEDEAGPLAPFVNVKDFHGNVFELAPGIEPLPAYGRPLPPKVQQPPDEMLDHVRQSQELTRKGAYLQSQEKVTEALDHYDLATVHDQRHSDLYNNLGVALRTSGRLMAAEACYRRSLMLAPQHAGCVSNLGNVLREMGRLEESAQYQDRALALTPDNPNLHYNAGLVARDDGRPKDSRRLFETVLSMDPGNEECSWDLALSKLQNGDYKEGFVEYESRWDLKRSAPRMVSLPRWNGEKLKGECLFLHDEQGFGDVLMFARFIPEAKARGAGKIILQCQPELMRLMAMAPGVDAVIARTSPTPPECQLFAPLLSLPGMFGHDLDSMPKTVPYLNAPAPAVPVPPAPGRLRMGLVWAGKPTPRDRSCPLDQLLPALSDPRFAVYSLQMGPRAADLKATGLDAFATDLKYQITDFAETAAVLKSLDLLVTCDTSIAHLAGALGVPTFVMLLYTSDWRWFDRRPDSPWYPSMRLMRQPTPGDWKSAVRELHKALDEFASSKAQPLPGLTHLP